MRDRVCVVTGASNGIGRETALGLARLGATVVLVCRDARRGEAALRYVRRGSSDAPPHLLLADLASQREVHGLADELLGRFPRVHVLVNNAALVVRDREITADRVEMQWAVNHLAPFLLTLRLVDRLRESARARIVNVASKLEARGVIDLDDLQMRRGYSPEGAYARSKLANVLFTHELARRTEGTGVTANSLHPGAFATHLLTDLQRRPRLLHFLTRRQAPSPEQGAVTSVHLASAPEVEGMTGLFFSPENDDPAGPYLIPPRPVQPSERSRDPELARRLWNASLEQVGLPRCPISASREAPGAVA